VAPTTTTTAAPAPNGEFKNHGDCVSQAAHDTPPGPGHGEAVSKVAKSYCGKKDKVEGSDEQGEQENEAPEAETDGGSHGNSNSNGHGNGHD
jgi:hypothetical protein